MKSSTKDKVEGAVKEATGKLSSSMNRSTGRIGSPPTSITTNPSLFEGARFLRGVSCGASLPTRFSAPSLRLPETGQRGHPRRSVGANYGDRKCKRQMSVTAIIAIRQSHTKMITTLISLLIAGLVLYVIYYVVGMFIKGQLLNIIGIVLGLLFLLYALRAFNIVAI